MKIAVLANPQAGMLRADSALVEELYQTSRKRATFAAPENLDTWQRELDDLLEGDVQRVVLIGGDGTTGRTFHELMKRFAPEDLPEIGLVHGGTMNSIARSLGMKGDPVKQLEGLLDPKAGQRTRRWPLRVEARRWGFLFGIGIIPRYIEAYDKTEGGPKAAAQVLLDKVVDAFKGGSDAEAFFQTVHAEIRVDGHRWPMRDWLVLAAGATDDLGLRFRPFPSVLENPGCMGVYASASKPSRFALDLLPFRLGLRSPHSLAFEAPARELRIQADRPLQYNLDGELHQARMKELVVQSGPPVTFVVPDAMKQPRHSLDEGAA